MITSLVLLLKITYNNNLIKIIVKILSKYSKHFNKYIK